MKAKLKPMKNRVFATDNAVLVGFGMTCRIVGSHHSARDIDTTEFRIIWDADWLVNIPDECGRMDKDKLREFIDRVFKMNKGREMAVEIFLHDGQYAGV